MDKNIIVTGGAGYIGSHICKALKERGYVPVVIDNLSRGYRNFVKWGPSVIGDIGDKQILKHAFDAYQPIAVIHCAGLTYVEESLKDPKMYYQNNVAGALCLLETMLEHSVSKIIFSSTAATYGQETSSPLLEDCPQIPINPYGRSKLIIEQIIKDFTKAYSLQYAILRYFNAAGADMEGEIGEYHIPETHLIPLILEVAAGKRKAISIYGTDYPTPDGSAIRDYIHVEDLARGHVQALECLIHSGESVVANLGSGRGTSVKEVIKVVEKVTGKQIPIHLAPRREGDPAVLVANIEKAKSCLKWSPDLSDLETIVFSAWNWLQAVIQEKPFFLTGSTPKALASK